MSVAKNRVFVYGTLRNGVPATHRLHGYRMFFVPGRNGNNFPFIQRTDGFYDDRAWYSVLGNIVEVTDKELEQADVYEGVSNGLYTREKLHVQCLSTKRIIEAWVYVGGPALVYQPIDSGDWFSR
jgi:gamma-glutamylcyclotransferase (GGCT)/AIG2-like uncharacterized protein YtfP